MPYHLKRPSQLNASVSVYYAGGRRWTDDYSQRVQYSTEAEINAMISNPDGMNGGWTNAVIVSE